jgi:hypothetical protein
MNTVLRYEIVKLSGKSSLNNFNKVITSITFKVKGLVRVKTDDESLVVAETEKIFGFQLEPPPKFPAPNSFIPYSDITEETVLMWIKTHPSYPAIQRVIDEELEAQTHITPNEAVPELDFNEIIFPWIHAGIRF